MKLELEETIFLARLLGHHFTAHAGESDEAKQAGALYNKAARHLAFVGVNVIDRHGPLDGLVIADTSHIYNGRVVLTFNSPVEGTSEGETV